MTPPNSPPPKRFVSIRVHPYEALLLQQIALCNRQDKDRYLWEMVSRLERKKLIIWVSEFKTYFVTEAGKAALLLFKHFGGVPATEG